MGHQETARTDTTIQKVSSDHSPKGEMGQIYLVSGKRVSMGLWRDEPPQKPKESANRDYETVGYGIAGRAELTLEGQTLTLEPGDSWLVPAGAEHTYRILEAFTAVEATAPPAQVHGREQSYRHGANRHDWLYLISVRLLRALSQRSM